MRIESDFREYGGLQIAVDTGGTFTDVAVRRPDGTMSVWKVPSTPNAPDEAVINGVAEAVEREEATPSEITRLVHGTTVATNTVLTRDGARVGLLTTRGFRDILAIAGQDRPNLYDAHEHRVEPLIAAADIVEIDERIDADGETITALSDEALDEAAVAVEKLNLDVLVVSFLNAYANPAHERRAAEYLAERNAAPSVVAATSITAEMREYDRTSTAAINAYVSPQVSSYMTRLIAGLKDLGVDTNMRVMQSNGGLLAPQIAAEHSARTVVSGLAGGVVGAANWSRQLGLGQVVSFDIGGTSTDIALIRDSEPDETTATTIGSLPLRLPSVDVHTIGAGGGSIAWLDSGGSLRVGPHSAGAVPGPIAYQRGGNNLTVTDAHVVLGHLSGSLLGGRFELDHEAAYAKMQELGDELGLSPEDCAEGIIQVITATMGRGIRKVSVERGIDVRACELMAFGGAGPLHGADLIHELGMNSAVIPPAPGIASAVGMLDAPVRLDFAAPTQVLDAAGFERLGAEFDSLVDDARTALGTDEFERSFLADCRYVGQSYELTIPLAENWQRQRAAFDDAHEQRYGFGDEDASMEIITVRLSATIAQPPAATEKLREVSAGDITPIDHREVYISGKWQTVPIFERRDIPTEHVLYGPAIINQFDSTTYIRPDQQCRCDEFGFLHLTRTEEA
ncbi:hydantoinase [Corynebacterium yudongzhengii]|uniref:Hydantoinase/oxoprolinase family protein n=1 Tax=Corynebacterium yudongzhengii TaxID=2080740 RepID=A0A2U1T439_9CORY|nr:hydantoinase/oxoprolinase family protein [Corynebacterium yudongzhengii]AWB82380.1 hydantoinase [Corynebacterium yudongzhengii]PWC00764.1 hydantoinase/oxoprolinase family protein [Corynebacterium yudongzhengii]